MAVGVSTPTHTNFNTNFNTMGKAIERMKRIERIVAISSQETFPVAMVPIGRAFKPNA